MGKIFTRANNVETERNDTPDIVALLSSPCSNARQTEAFSEVFQHRSRVSLVPRDVEFAFGLPSSRSLQ